MEPIVAVTALTKDIYIRFNQFHIRRHGTMACIAILGVFGVVTLALGLAAAVVGSPDAGRKPMMIGGVLVVMLFATVLALRHQQKQYFDKAPATLKLPQQYVFAENAVIVDTLSDTVHNHGEYLYTEIYKVYETPRDFYLYVSPNQAVILPKECLQNAAPEGLRALLQSRISSKKYICRVK